MINYPTEDFNEIYVKAIFVRNNVNYAADRHIPKIALPTSSSNIYNIAEGAYTGSGTYSNFLIGSTGIRCVDVRVDGTSYISGAIMSLYYR